MLLILFFFFSSRRRHTRCLSDWSSDVCSSDLDLIVVPVQNGDGGEFAHFLISREGVHRLADFKDKIVEAKSSPAGDIFALSRAGAPNGKIVKLSMPASLAQSSAPLSLTTAPVVVPESDVT